MSQIFTPIKLCYEKAKRMKRLDDKDTERLTYRSTSLIFAIGIAVIIS